MYLLGRPPPLQGCIQLLSLSPPAGTLARGARSRPNPLAVTGLDPGLVPAGGECYRGRLGMGSSARVLVPRVPSECKWLVGWKKPDEIFSKSHKT